MNQTQKDKKKTEKVREIAEECKRNIREDRQRDKKIKRPHFWQCILRFKTSIKIVAISFAIFAVT